MEFTEIPTVPNKNSIIHTHIYYLMQSDIKIASKILITKRIRFIQVSETKVLEPEKNVFIEFTHKVTISTPLQTGYSVVIFAAILALKGSKFPIKIIDLSHFKNYSFHN